MVAIAPAAKVCCTVLLVALDSGPGCDSVECDVLLPPLSLLLGAAADVGECRLIHACCSMAVADGRVSGCFCSACDSADVCILTTA